MITMENLIDEMKIRKMNLTKVVNICQKKNSTIPEGKLRISRDGTRFRYYEIRNSKDTRGKYIKNDDLKVAIDLAEKDYIEKLRRQVEKEIIAIERAINILERSMKDTVDGKNSAEDIYSELNEGRKILISPLLVNDDEYEKKWEKMQYKKSEYKLEEKIYQTKKGDLVRSKSEVMIADMYYELGIPYRYEAELILNNGKKVYPDFTILDKSKRKEIFHEHMGLLDNDDYRLHNLKKIEEYRKNDIFMGNNLIITFEVEGCPLNIRDIEKSMRKLFNNY
ncbi:MAG: hypothetical protein K6A23_01235 [Butyrivibrio sp.]|nr:hypothetical protein [Butyrivibrio sp.]